MSPSASNTFPRIKLVLSLSLLLLQGLISARPVAGDTDVLIELEQEVQPEVIIAVPAVDLAGAADPSGVSREVRDTLENDLKISEFFVPLGASMTSGALRADASDPEKEEMAYEIWREAGAQWVVRSALKLEEGGSIFSVDFRLFDAVSEKFLMSRTYRGPMANLRRSVHRYADEVVGQLTGKRGVAETRIAFVSPRIGNREVFVVDFDGQNLKQLTKENSLTLNPAWSPDGRQLLYTSYAARNPDLMIMDDNGKRRKVLMSLPGLNASPAWSPDGDKIALVLSRDLNAEIYILQRNGPLKRLTRHFNIDTSPTWSPDSKRIAFTSDRSGTAEPQIFIMDAAAGEDGEMQRISFGSSYNDDPSWSPDGDRIAYTSRMSSGFRIRIYDLPTQKTFLFTQGVGQQEHPVWSPDGRYIAYTQKEKGNTALYIKRVGSKRARQLTFLPSGVGAAAWSPFFLEEKSTAGLK